MFFASFPPPLKSRRHNCALCSASSPAIFYKQPSRWGLGVVRGASRPHDVWKTARIPEQGSKISEAVSDSVNTIASLTEFTLRSSTCYQPDFARRMMPHLIFYKHIIKIFSKEQSKSKSFKTCSSDEDDFEAYESISPSPCGLRTYSL